ncbi:large ribosomal subunit protein mL49-like [Acropora palmata]|uniref:large ribosomal subunit protein mL49-like n=1 Tax=Acropora palmata TaxID=6131 RepID=UPI003DA048FE
MSPYTTYITLITMAAATLCRICNSFISTPAAVQLRTLQSVPRVARITPKIPKHRQNKITYNINPERLRQIEESPSGWVPPSTEAPDLPFFIKRSKFNNLPVYTDYKRGGNYKLTVIRKIEGDLQALDGVLRDRLGKDIHCQINELTSQLKIKGIHKDAVVTVLKQLGF